MLRATGAVGAPCLSHCRPAQLHSLCDVSVGLFPLSSAARVFRYRARTSFPRQTGRRSTVLTRAGRQLYPASNPYSSGCIAVDEVHQVYYEVHGNDSGIPALVLHGGPGAGCFKRHAQFFDGKFYKVVLMDQRGCGRSKPKGCLENNTTHDLIDDIETVREHLGIQKWGVILGGSWGTTLALAYAQRHADTVHALILRGISLLDSKDLHWFYGPGGGASMLFPAQWELFVAGSGIDGMPDSSEQLISAYYAKLTDPEPEVRAKAASSWLGWEMGKLSLSQSSQVQVMKSEKLIEPRAQTEKVGEGGPSRAESSLTPSDKAASCSSFEAQARLEAHYFHHKGWLHEKELLDNVGKVADSVKCIIVHGRYDFVCPVDNCWQLKKVWPQAELRVVGMAGHSMYESGILSELVDATDRVCRELKSWANTDSLDVVGTTCDAQP